MQTPLTITCPHCGQPSENIKRVQIWMLFFLFIGYYVRRSTVTGCRECLRGKLISNALINILTANIIWPIIIMPMTVYQYFRVGSDGHDDSVMSDIQTRFAVMSAQKQKRGF